MMGQVAGWRVMETIRYHTARFDILVGALSLALALALAGFSARKRDAARDLSFGIRTTILLVAGSVTLLLAQRPRKSS